MWHIKPHAYDGYAQSKAHWKDGMSHQKIDYEKGSTNKILKGKKNRGYIPLFQTHFHLELYFANPTSSIC
jgi:hypothetical protein